MHITDVGPAAGTVVVVRTIDPIAEVPPATAGTGVRAGAPSGGGLRGALRGLSGLRVPSPRSVVASSLALVTLLLLFGGLVVTLDRVLVALLAGPVLPGRAAVGAFGLCCALVALALLPDLAFDAPTQPRRVRPERRRVRLAFGTGCAASAVFSALYWAVGLL